MNSNSAERYLRQPYARVVIPAEGHQFHAEILEFPGCYAQGGSVGEAYANLEEAAEAWIETCLTKGQSIPEPSSNLGFNGNILLRLPRSIHRKAAQMAERDRTSLNQYLVSAVSTRVGVDDFHNLLIQRLEHRLVKTMMHLAQQAIYVWDTYSQKAQTSMRDTTIKAFPVESGAATEASNASMGR